jgi:hypothetical protein
MYITQSLVNFVPSLGRTGVSIEIKELSVFVFVDRNGLCLGLRLCCSCFFLIFDYFLRPCSLEAERKIFILENTERYRAGLL